VVVVLGRFQKQGSVSLWLSSLWPPPTTSSYHPSLLLMHSLGVRHQVIRCAPLAAVDDMDHGSHLLELSPRLHPLGEREVEGRLQLGHAPVVVHQKVLVPHQHKVLQPPRQVIQQGLSRDITEHTR
jgi:hypothetical protein